GNIEHGLDHAYAIAGGLGRAGFDLSIDAHEAEEVLEGRDGDSHVALVDGQRLDVGRDGSTAELRRHLLLFLFLLILVFFVVLILVLVTLVCLVVLGLGDARLGTGGRRARRRSRLWADLHAGRLATESEETGAALGDDGHVDLVAAEVELGE